MGFDIKRSQGIEPTPKEALNFRLFWSTAIFGKMLLLPILDS